MVSRASQLILEWMKKEGKNQAQAARHVAVSQGEISRYLSGRRKPDAITRQVFMLKLGVPFGAWEERALRKAA